jgi:hypothetical protein
MVVSEMGIGEVGVASLLSLCGALSAIAVMVRTEFSTLGLTVLSVQIEMSGVAVPRLLLSSHACITENMMCGLRVIRRSPGCVVPEDGRSDL